LSKNAKRKHVDSDDEEEGAENDYRGIERPKSLEPADPDTQYELDGVTIDTEVTCKNANSVRRTREHPEDLQGWQAYIDHQEAMLKLERPSTELSESDRAHLAHVRIAIYEEALKKAGKDQATQLELHKGLLKEAQRAWDGTKLTSKWKDVLSKHPYSIDLWLMYLDFVQSRFTSFKYEECRSIFFKCLDALCTNKDIPPAMTLHVLLRLTSMTHEAGYQELALAVWQAILEFCLMRPESEVTLQAFEEFWESEIPRIGEPEAKGWKNSNLADAPPGGPSAIGERDSSDTVFEDFRKRETEAANKLRYPGRASDDVGEDDAFHTIFFSDLDPYLKSISADTPALLLVQAFLGFCGLPQLPDLATPQQEWCSDSFLQRRWHPFQSTNESSQFTQILERFSASPIRKFQMTTELLFEQEFSLKSISLSADFIRRLLRLLALEPASDEVMGQYLLAFELRHFPSEAFKTAKRLLKTRPASLRLYNAYGLVEFHRGNSAKAAQVFSAALSMQKEGATLSTPDSLELFSSWAWEALHRGEQTEALWRLVSPRGNIPTQATLDAQPDHILISTTRTDLSSVTEHALLHQNHISAVLSTSLSALLAYLINDHNPTHALSIHHDLSAWFASHALTSSVAAEQHAQAIARFLTHHITHAPIVKPALIRLTLEPLITTFPDNTVLLSLYAANEVRFSIDDRVRGIMHQSTLRSTEERSVAAWAFSIHYETLKGEIAGSTSHSIRALYKRATETTGAHCPAIWNAYVCFELAQLRQERALRPAKRKGKWENRVCEAETKVKETFYAGLRNLPWCKEYVMLAFTVAKDVFVEEELWRVYRVMQEKELRLYVELDETEV
jgi:tetratricopeptide (TPR) repeat protein